jgi:hypothetical protein
MEPFFLFLNYIKMPKLNFALSFLFLNHTISLGMVQWMVMWLVLIQVLLILLPVLYKIWDKTVLKIVRMEAILCRGALTRRSRPILLPHAQMSQADLLRDLPQVLHQLLQSRPA